MIQLAWRFLMFQRNSALAQWFRARTENARGTRKLMIVALARKLLIALWRLVREGVVPDGVILRPTFARRERHKTPGERAGSFRQPLGASQLATGGAPILDGRRQPSCDGTSRMTRECQVRICERLGVQFSGPTRPWQNTPSHGRTHLRPKPTSCRRGWTCRLTVSLAYGRIARTKCSRVKGNRGLSYRSTSNPLSPRRAVARPQCSANAGLRTDLAPDQSRVVTRLRPRSSKNQWLAS